MRWLLALLLLVSVGAGLAWWSSAAHEAEDTSQPALALQQVQPVVAEAPASSAAAAASEPASVAGAVLIDVPAAPASAVASTLSASPLAALATASEAPPKASAVPDTAAAPSRATTSRQPKPEVTAPKANHVAKQKVAAATTQAKTTKPTSTDGTRTPDADVALLEAMVAHISSGSRSGGGVASAPGSTAKGSRTSTREQLKRCKAQTGAEASACRAKVCSGRWGADPECPTLPRGTASN